MDFIALVDLNSLAAFARFPNENALAARFACAFDMEIRQRLKRYAARRTKSCWMSLFHVSSFPFFSNYY
jgi:hypothetical protein